MERSPDQPKLSKIIATALGTTGPLQVALGEKTMDCPDHGPYVSAGARYMGKHEVWTGCPTCEELSLAAERQAKAAEAAERARRNLEKQIATAAIPPRFIGRTFENFKASTPAQQAVLKAAITYVDNFEAHLKKGEGLIFGGMPGTGKSHLAAAILQAVMPLHVGLYTTCMSMIREVRATWRKASEKSESEVLAIYCGADLLVLDEIGVQYGTDGEQTIIFDVLDRRYRDMKPTILLTNQDSAGLRQYIGDRCFDRLRESSRWYTFDWESYRPQARKESYAG